MTLLAWIILGIVAGFNFYNLLVAVVGAALLLVVYHAVSRDVR